MVGKQMTMKQYRNIETKMRQIQNELLPKARKDYERAKSNGDMRENDEADSARAVVTGLMSQLRNLEKSKSEAVICEDRNVMDDSIGLGSRITFLIDTEQMTKSVSNSELEYMDTVSVDSTLGKLLVGRHIGDAFTYEDKLGKLHRVRILEVV